MITHLHTHTHTSDQLYIGHTLSSKATCTAFKTITVDDSYR